MDEIEREAELIDYIEVVWSRRRLIIGGSLLCVVVTAVFVLVSPRIYEARALIVVSPGVTNVAQGSDNEGIQQALGTEIVVPGLAAETYEALAKGDELLNSLKDSLLRAGLDSLGTQQLRDVGLVEMAQTMLDAELLKATEKAKSPVLALRAQSTSNELPVGMVNLWAELFVERNRGLSSTVADDYYQWVQERYEGAKAQLEHTEEELRKIRSTYHNLNVLQGEVRIKMRRLKSALQSYQSAETALEATQQEQIYLEAELAKVETNGVWLRYIDTEDLPPLETLPPETPAVRRGLIRALSELRQAEADSLYWGPLHAERRRQLQIKISQERLALEQQTGSGRLRTEVASLESTATAFRVEAASLDQQLKLLRTRLEVSRKNLEDEPRVLTVKKAISDQTLWEKVTREGKADVDVQKELGRYRLISEELNPTYLELSSRTRSLEVQYGQVQSRIDFLHREIPTMESRLLVTRARLDTIQKTESELLKEQELESIAVEMKIQQEVAPVLERLIRYRRVVQDYESEHADMSRQVERLKRESISLASDLRFRQRSFQHWSEQLRLREAKMDSMQLVRTRLERNLTVFQTTFRRLAKLVEEARIARVQAGGDIQVVSKAIVSRGVARGTVSKAGIAGVLGLMASLLLAFLLEYVAKSRKEASAGTTTPSAT